jgi:hypothetical protein
MPPYDLVEVVAGATNPALLHALRAGLAPALLPNLPGVSGGAVPDAFGSRGVSSSHGEAAPGSPRARRYAGDLGQARAAGRDGRTRGVLGGEPAAALRRARSGSVASTATSWLTSSAGAPAVTS